MKTRLAKTELRIGNSIRDAQTKGIKKVTTGMLSNWERLHSPPHEGYEPVEITESELLKYGFRKIDERTFKFPKSNWELWSTDGFFWSTDNGLYSLGLRICYIHQLQNLYFALTERELEVVTKYEEK